MNKYAAEMVGTFVLVFGGIGTAFLAGDHVGWLGVGLAFGLSLLAMAYTIGPISGCHINPAVTIGLLINKKIDAKEVPGYIIAQIVGAILGAGGVYLIACGNPAFVSATGLSGACNGYGEHSPGGYDLVSAFVAEVFLTGLLVLVVHGTTDIKAPVGFAGIPIGLVLVVIHFVGIPIDNLSANPARSIATAVFSGGWALEQLWVFIVAPVVGGILAAFLYQALRTPDAVITTKTAEQSLKSEQAERG